MSIEIPVPDLGESVSEATVASWFKKEGEAIKKDEPVCELETDKVTLEVNAPADGVLEKISAKEGATVQKGAVLGSIKEGAAAPANEPAPAKVADKGEKVAVTEDVKDEKPQGAPQQEKSDSKPAGAKNPPSVEKIAAEKDLDLAKVEATGKDGRHTKGDVLKGESKPAAASAAASTSSTMYAMHGDDKPQEERVKMTKLRQAIARRLKESQNTAAILTTFNEVDMSRLMDLRKEHKENFEKKTGQRLGFMGFFVKASIQALSELPAVNAHIEGDEIIYKHYYNIGVAVGTEQGLVVPVVKHAERMSLAQIEGSIGELAKKARNGALSMSDMAGGTFTITNGGVYGSLLATPIINPPQSAILGMHKIEDRPVVVNGQIVIRPMMYIALSYDHRIIDGQESVTFLKRVKELIEDPARLVLGV